MQSGGGDAKAVAVEKWFRPWRRCEPPCWAGERGGNSDCRLCSWMV